VFIDNKICIEMCVLLGHFISTFKMMELREIFLAS
jgi:hypothetical protein